MTETETAAPKPNPNHSSLCQECGLSPWKYKCPGCLTRSCSLPCVKSHKQHTNCTGKRSRTEFVPLSQFNDNLLISDYDLLQETKRIAERAQRMRQDLCGTPSFRLPTRLRLLQKAARKRKTRVLFLPMGMSKREINQSRYDQKKNTISWTIEWKFHSTDVVLIDHGVEEHTNLFSVLENHLKPGPWKHHLEPFCEEQLHSLKCFIRKDYKGPKSSYRELSIKAPLSKQLANVVIVEYPIIHVLLPSHNCDFEVEKHTSPYYQKVEPTKAFDDPPCPKGILFREEEIEDNDASVDTQVLDLMNYATPELIDKCQIPDGGLLSNRRVGKEGALLDSQLSGRVAEETRLLLNNELQTFTAEDADRALSSSTASIGDLGFDFEQDIKDAYSSLIEEANPDGFLCLESEFIKDDEQLERKGSHSFSDGVLPVEEDVEEGEIVEL